LTSYLRVHKLFLLKESLITYKATAVTVSFRHHLVSELLKLIQ